MSDSFESQRNRRAAQLAEASRRRLERESAEVRAAVRLVDIAAKAQSQEAIPRPLPPRFAVAPVERRPTGHVHRACGSVWITRGPGIVEVMSESEWAAVER